MLNGKLRDINFKVLLNYRDGPPEPLHRYSDEFLQDQAAVVSFCTRCHDGDKPACREDHRLWLVSHGADASDFERLLGPMPPDRPECAARVAFVFEAPGKDPRARDTMTYEGSIRARPIGYTWMPHTDRWPETAGAAARIAAWGDKDTVGDGYGPQIAYLARLFGFRSVYVTNAVKCSMEETSSGALRNYGLGASDPLSDVTRETEKLCIENYLRKEFDEFEPDLVLAFGGRTSGLLEQHFPERRFRIVNLVHPSPRSRRWYPTLEDRIKENARRICAALGCDGCETALQYPNTDGQTRWRGRHLLVAYFRDDPQCDCELCQEGQVPHRHNSESVVWYGLARITEEGVKEAVRALVPGGTNFAIVGWIELAADDPRIRQASLEMEAEALGLTADAEPEPEWLKRIDASGLRPELDALLKGIPPGEQLTRILTCIDQFGLAGRRLLETCAGLLLGGYENRDLYPKLRRLGDRMEN